MITSWFIIPFLCVGAQGLKCWEGRALDAVAGNFTSTPCREGETFCMEIHTKDEGKPTEDFKTCWDPTWDNGLYGSSDYGCMSGQHCLGGVCYENATVCLCKEDDCNDFLPDGSGAKSTPHPWVPSVPKDNHTCYYGSLEGQEGSLDYVQVCTESETLCVKVTTDSGDDPETDFQFRSCWSGGYAGEEFTRPGCYKGFPHCHITQAGEQCHNDTTICVCAGKNCNSDTYSSAAPPYTPGSGLVCYVEDEHHHGPGRQADTKLCGKNETYCISAFDDSTSYSWRGCWSGDYEEGRYANFTGCETGQHCMFGTCRDNTVCLCQGDLCNDFEIKENATTPEPVPMTTTNMTNVCYYGMVKNVTASTPWGSEACGPQETACMYLTGDDGFALASCYDFKYDDGKYNETLPDGKYKCYDSGEHCWDNECHTGQLCLCQNAEPSMPCNNPVGPTPKPESTTPGSGLSCWYGDGVENSGQLKFNLTEQKCNVNETMCISVYGDEDLGDKVRHFFAQCHDPRYQDGRFNQSDMCIDGQYCHDGGHHGPHLGRDDPPPACFNDNVCTCSTSLCNTYNVSSTDNPGTEPSTVASTPRCSFGEQHPGTGQEDWKVEVCQHNENYCYQMVTKEGFESRSCWDLAYEDDEYRDTGCYTGRHCHHEHCFDEATVCICSGPNCNEWTPNGTVTTDVPVTNPSSVLCYQGSYEHYLADPCPWNKTMCSYMLVDDGHELVDCFNPYSNNGTYYAEACYNDVDIEFHGHMRHGKLCVCDGLTNDLCNGEFFKNQDNSASKFLTGGLFSILVASLLATLGQV